MSELIDSRGLRRDLEDLFQTSTTIPDMQRRILVDEVIRLAEKHGLETEETRCTNCDHLVMFHSGIGGDGCWHPLRAAVKGKAILCQCVWSRVEAEQVKA